MNRITSAIDAVRMDDLHSTEEQFRAAHPLCWQLTLYGPVLLTAGILGVLLVHTGWEFTSKLVTSALVTVFFLGRFIILSGAQGTFQDTDGSLASEHLFALVCYLDVMTALMLAFHIGFLFRVPYIGPRVAALVTDGHFILDAQPWMRRATFIGLIAFVGFPLAATGSIGGSIFGRLLGMSRIATFFGIVTGTLLGNATMFWFSDMLGHFVDKENFYLKYGGLLIIAAIVVVLERRYRMLKNRYASGQLAPPSSAGPSEADLSQPEPGEAGPNEAGPGRAGPSEAGPSGNGAVTHEPGQVVPVQGSGEQAAMRQGLRHAGNEVEIANQTDHLKVAAGEHVGPRPHPR